MEKLDITDSREAASVFQDVERRLGPVDILVNNAGVVRGKSEAVPPDGGRILEKTDRSESVRHHDLHPAGTRRNDCAQIRQNHQYCLDCRVSGLPGWADYAASKGGVIMFSETVAMEVGKYGITVNCISPGMIGGEAKPCEGTWLGRTGTAADISNMVVYLASPEADFITGSNYMVDGGRVIGPKNASWNE